MTEIRFFDELGAELQRAALRRPEREHRRWRFPVGGTVAFASTLVSVVIAVAAIALLSHARAQHHTGGSMAPAGAGALISRLAVLRRPQTAADRTLPPTLAQTFEADGQGARIVPSLTRLVAVVPAPNPGYATTVRFFLIVSTPPNPSSATGQDADVVSLAKVGDGGGISGSWRASSLSSAANAFPSSGNGYSSAIVPDGVARVQWIFHIRAAGSPHSSNPILASVSPTVASNVAIAPIQAGQDRPAVVTWFGADGTVVRKFARPPS